MTRWHPDARNRLAEAALQLYAERGFEPTTVAEIARRAGLTERTFFRHYADKREVLFAGAERFEQVFVSALEEAVASTAPFAAVAQAVVAAGEFLEQVRGRDSARQRQAIIAANAELRERELIKMASVASAMAEALRRHGVPDPVARLTAEAGAAVFRVAFERWVGAEGDRTDLPALVRDSLDGLRGLVETVQLDGVRDAGFEPATT